MVLIFMILYLAIGYFVIRKMDFEMGEIFAILMALWPLLLAGKILEVVLKKTGLYTPVLQTIFFTIIAILTIIIFGVISSQMFRY